MINEELDVLEKSLLEFAFQKRNVVRLLLISLLIKGHILIEDLPGVGKTTLAKAFSALLGRKFSRVQGTSDTLPQDILGGEIIDLKTNEFKIKKGPIFAEIILIDEINRMHPKTQSALMEAMEEKQISIAGKLYTLPDIHMIIATQNPIEYEGTYPLPEAQRDRFFCILEIGFPDSEIQKEILSSQSYLKLSEKIKNTSKVISNEQILELQKKVQKIHISDDILKKLIEFADWTRDRNYFRYGISPRGLSIFSSALRANAFLENRDFVIPEDGLFLINPVLKHRIEYLDESLTEEELKKLMIDNYKKIFKRM